MAARLIKKYPNRRLYDTHTSNYITLDDVRKLVLAHEEFQVVDAKSGADLTRSILLQIILEAEAGGAPMFSSDMLAQMIRFYGSATQGAMGQYLEASLRAFLDMQAEVRDQTKNLMAVPDLLQNQWRSMMSAFMPGNDGDKGRK